MFRLAVAEVNLHDGFANLSTSETFRYGFKRNKISGLILIINEFRNTI